MSVKSKLKKSFIQWKNEIINNKEVLFFSLFLLILATVIDYAAGRYTTKTEGTVAGDVFLKYFGPTDLSFIFVYGWMVISLFLFLYPLFFEVNKLHSTISQFSLLIMIRSFFITLTHLKTPIDAIAIAFPGAINIFAFQNDLFFSGHTAVPFLGYLLFKDKKIRIVFLLASILMAFTVLLMHQHYTIDVLSAYFITYGAYKIGNRLFSVIKPKKKKN